MAEFVAPGVFVQEVSSGPRSIEGVPTSTAGFVGTTSTGPTQEPVLVDGVAEHEATFGDRCRLAQAARAFFANGGRRLYVQRVAADDYEGALEVLDSVPEIALVAAPGADAAVALVAHATRLNRFALIDPPQGQTVDEVVAWRKQIDSPHAAVYFPWVRTRDAVAPSSGFVAGLYARMDAAHGVRGAPVQEALSEAVGVERSLTREEINLLVTNGINPLRELPDGTIGPAAAHTTSSVPEWTYVAVRRYSTYLEQSIDSGTQWTVFEPNGPPLWAEVRLTITSFLETEYRAGSLLGSRPEEAYFVKCDRSTMTQNDLDEGLLVYLVGVAALRPAEFVVFRIGRWTADHRP